MRLLIYASAVVVAPFFEELLFRGHVQTLLGRFLRGVIVPLPRLAAASPGEPVLSYESAADRSLRDEATARWLAILITSALFALVHEALWMMPPIFLLSICLGYVYERTGSLWAAIVVHTMFNLVNVLIFVALAAR
jgi:membrane protease YdiL (CAAX protease family)